MNKLKILNILKINMSAVKKMNIRLFQQIRIEGSSLEKKICLQFVIKAEKSESSIFLTASYFPLQTSKLLFFLCHKVYEVVLM